MDAGPDLLTLEQIGKYNAMCERGEITKEKMEFYKHNACPSCGACSFMGTASTMQVMAEALGLMLPGSALMPATSKDLREFAKKAGKQAVWLAEHNLTPDKIVTMKSFENAIMVHAAISGSTNSLLHIPAIAREFGIEIDGDTFDRLHRGAHYLLNISRSFFADSSYMLSFSVLCSCVCSRLISPSVSSWHKQDNTLMHQSPGHIQRRTPYNF